MGATAVGLHRSPLAEDGPHLGALRGRLPLPRAPRSPTTAWGHVTVGAGAAWIDGHYCEQLTSSSVAVTSNGLVVIRLSPAANTFELLYRDGATTPTQTTATWELPIARMTGGR